MIETGGEGRTANCLRRVFDGVTDASSTTQLERLPGTSGSGPTLKAIELVSGIPAIEPGGRPTSKSIET